MRLQARARDKHEKATKETLQRLHQVLSTRGSRFHSEYLPSTFLIVPLSFYIYIYISFLSVFIREGVEVHSRTFTHSDETAWKVASPRGGATSFDQSVYICI